MSSSLPVNTTTGTLRSVGLRLDALEQLEPGHVGQAQVEDAAIEGLAPELVQRFGAAGCGVDLDVVVAE